MTTDLSGVSALIVDDNATNREILEQQLQSWNVRTVSAHSGPQALKIIKASVTSGQPFGLLILDMQMPQMSGNDLANAIAADQTIPPTPMIMLSSVADHSYANGERHPIIDVYLNKPVRQEDLRNSVATLLENKTAPAAKPPPKVLEPATLPQDPQPMSVQKVPQAIRRILVVEDNVINQVVVQEMLSDFGCLVKVAENGEDALRMTMTEHFDLILMDCQMPVMDGYEATRRIRERERHAPDPRHVPIVALTARAMMGDRELCMTSGSDDYLSKPFSQITLRAMIERWIPG